MSQRRTPLKFNDLDSLLNLANHLRLHLDREIDQQHGLTSTQVQALMFIACEADGPNGCTAARIEAHLGLPKATNQFLVRRLKELGLVDVNKDAWADARRKQLRLTQEGADVVRDAITTWRHASARLLRAVETSALIDLARAAHASRASQRRLHDLYKLEDNKDWKHHKGRVLVADSNV